jgi:hypothetical protein
VDLLNLFIHFISYLSSWLQLVISMVSLVRIHSYFISLDIMVEYNCLNTCLYTL